MHCLLHPPAERSPLSARRLFLQLLCVEEGPYLHSLEHLLLGGNVLLLPSQMPASLQSRARLRRLSLPLWWQQLGVGHAADALLAAMPWLQLEAS